MEPILDKTFAGTDEMVLVWNDTDGFLEVSEEGYLLTGKTVAWVMKSPIIDDLVMKDLLIIVGAPVIVSDKKKPKKEKAGTTHKADKSPDESEVVAQIDNQDQTEETGSGGSVNSVNFTDEEVSVPFKTD